MDTARNALRLGSSHHCLPPVTAGNAGEACWIHHAEEEGIEFRLLTNPIMDHRRRWMGQGDGMH